MAPTTSVYLADLRHDYSGVLALDHMPLSVGYMKAVMDRELPQAEVESRLFAYPETLLAALAESPPDVLMVTNYVWNEALSRFVLQRCKQVAPDVLTVMGGPNHCVEAKRQIDFVAAHPEVDLYVTGEGDFLASEIVQLYLGAGKVKERLFEREIPSSIYQRDGAMVRTETQVRRKALDDIPSPWLSGVLDEFFDGRLCPLFETNRGCPFHCTFCVQGTDYYNKVSYFDLDRVQEEVDYIGRRIHQRSPNIGTLRIADPNYGMYKRDVEIAASFARAQKDHGWPTFIDATTGKNKPERIIECVEKANGALVVYQAVQSLDDEVLRNVSRSNIKLDAYSQIMIHVRGRGLRSNSDLILGLPGETLESHLRGLGQLVDSGTDECNCFQAMMLKGSDLESLEMRSRYGFDTRFRLLPRDYGEYRDEKVFDVEEIVVGTDSLPFDDYVRARKHHLAFGLFWNDSLFSDVVALAENAGIDASDWLTAMLEAMERDTGATKRLLDDFADETRGELFPSAEACREFYADPANFERLRRGEIGDNVLYKHRALGTFHRWKDVCACAMNATRALLDERGALAGIADLDGFWRDLHAWVEAQHASGHDVAQVTGPVEVRLHHDLRRWADDGAPLDVAPYRLPRQRRFRFALSPDRKRELEGAFQTWSMQLGGLTRLIVRIRRDWLVRDCQPL